MFRISQSESYFWPVVVELASNGKFDKQQFQVEFKRISQTRLQEVTSNAELKAVDLCREVVIGWKDVKDNQGKDIDFSPSQLEQMLDVVGVSKAIVDAFIESVEGAKRKNS